MWLYLPDERFDSLMLYTQECPLAMQFDDSYSEDVMPFCERREAGVGSG